MSARHLPAGLLALTLTASAFAALPARAQPALSTPDFIKTAAATDLFERQAGAVAVKRGRTAKVRSFGEMMIRDHAKTTAGLKRAIMKAGLPKPPPPMLTPDQSKMLADLKAAPRKDFDKMYIGDQVMAHQQALQVIQSYAMGGDQPAIKAAAAKTVPIVQHHLMVAESIEG